MFKALDHRTDEEIIILSPAWAERIPELRGLDAKDILVCQECRHPVRVRAGAVKRAHFAHKHLGNCRIGQESPALLAARALLYQRLAREFGDQVTLEKRLDDERFPRPVDCWVESDAGPLAWWILDKPLRPERREELIRAFRKAKATVTWVFTQNVLHAAEENAEIALLTTTERELKAETWFDADLKGTAWVKGETLHYLDPAQGILTTFRGLRLVHEPAAFHGRRLSTPLADVLVSRKTGEFAHPGERERMRALRELKADLDRREKERKEREQRDRREREARARQAEQEAERERRARQAQWEHLRQEREAREREEQQQREQEAQARREREQAEEEARQRAEEERRAREREEIRPFEEAERERWQQISRARGPGAPRPDGGGSLSVLNRAGTCVFCGRLTEDWWSFDNATRTCKCKECYRQGKY